MASRGARMQRAGLGLIQAPPEPMSDSLLYAHRRNLPKRVRVFMDWAAEILAPVLVHRP